MEISNTDAARLSNAYGELGGVLAELGLLNSPQPPVDPRWMRDTARQWGLIDAAAQINGGDLGAGEWSRLGRQHGYDPRGLGGFFQGSQPLMARQGERRRLTEHGWRFIDRWRADFRADGTA